MISWNFTARVSIGSNLIAGKKDNNCSDQRAEGLSTLGVGWEAACLSLRDSWGLYERLAEIGFLPEEDLLEGGGLVSSFDWDSGSVELSDIDKLQRGIADYLG
jgi:hypothetical protein